MSWGIEYDGALLQVAFTKRRYAQLYVGRRWIGAEDFKRAAGRNDISDSSDVGNASKVWKVCKQKYPSLRLVHVSVSYV